MGKYLLIPPEHGPDVLGNSNLLALTSHIVAPYYFGFGTAAAHYGLTTQIRNVIYVVSLEERRPRVVHDSRVHIVKQTRKKFFGFAETDVLGYKVMMSDKEKTSIDCIDHHELAGGVGEAATILATATRRNILRASTPERWHAVSAGCATPSRRVRACVQTIALKSRETWLGAAPKHKVPDVIGYDEIWRVFVNVPRAELQGSAGLGQRKTVKRSA